jgi:hypothetical protein
MATTRRLRTCLGLALTALCALFIAACGADGHDRTRDLATISDLIGRQKLSHCHYVEVDQLGFHYVCDEGAFWVAKDGSTAGSGRLRAGSQ